MKALKIIGIIAGAIIVLALAALMVVGLKAPETFIYLEREVPKKYVAKMTSLGLLEEGEKVKFFYSDAIWNITEGLYAATDRRLIIYVEEWQEPSYTITYTDITSIDFQADDSFLTDSWVIIGDTWGEKIEFPLSSEKGRDHKFIDFLYAKTDLSKTQPPKKGPTPLGDTPTD